MNPDQPTGIFRNATEYADPEFGRFLRRSFLASTGLDDEDLERPVVGIAHTCSDYVTCHRHMPELVDRIKAGVLQAGGLPMSFPVMSLGEILFSPTTMLYRNLMAMETEELIRAQPMDAVVLLGGCDKTVPAQLMAAASAGVPALLVVAGPMSTGNWRGERVGACTDCRRMWAEHRAGTLSDAALRDVGQTLCPTSGTCMVMGTASTMACLSEAMGMVLAGGAAIPAVSSARLRHAAQSGRRAVELARDPIRPADVLTPAAFHNAITVLAALGGSTNAVIHLLAVARRAGVDLTLDDFDRLARQTPVLVDCKPTGTGYMDDFHNAGGVPVLLTRLESLLDLSAIRIDGQTLEDSLAHADLPPSQGVIRTLDDPVKPGGSLAVLRGSLAPDGAIIKAFAADPALGSHVGPAAVFDSPADVTARIDDPSLALTPSHVLVLRNAGPVAAGMPEAGALPIPRYLAEAGVRDMVRISDARMSGTAYGTVILHCSPEAAAGGPLGRVRDGDLISVDIPSRRLDLLVDEAELRSRQSVTIEPPQRSWRRLHAERVLPAHLGADLDFLSSA